MTLCRQQLKVSEPSTTRGLLCTANPRWSTPRSLRTLNYERAIVPHRARLTTNPSLRTLNYERAIVQKGKGKLMLNKSQNPQLREGYCAVSFANDFVAWVSEPSTTRGLLCDESCRKHINKVSEPSTTRGLLCTLKCKLRFALCLRTLNYERAIVHRVHSKSKGWRLRTLNYERAIVQGVWQRLLWPQSQNPQLREGYCARIWL